MTIRPETHLAAQADVLSGAMAADCGSDAHLSRRKWLTLAGGAAASSWLTVVGQQLARAQEQAPRGAAPRSLIVLWLAGGPSQLETFDPHPGSPSGGETQARKTAAPGIQLAAGFEQLADVMGDVSLVRSVVSKEGDHERATYNVKTGYRPDPTLVHPAIGAVVCHQLKDQLEIPRHVSILPGQWPARGGYLGDRFDAFKIGDPVQRIPDIAPSVPPGRFERRLDDLFKVVEPEFRSGRLADLDERRTLHIASIKAARKMMASEQLAAFDVRQAPQRLRAEYGDTPFGRGCLAAARLIEAGVRCVEVTLGGWDTHIDNHDLQAKRVGILDPALAALIRDLKRRQLLQSTLVLCGGEFGRTPRINPAGGRDHWPHGFSVAMAGGGIPGGRVIGETDPDPRLDVDDKTVNVKGPRPVEDVHATLLKLLGIHYKQQLDTPIGRPMAISQGQPIEALLS